MDGEALEQIRNNPELKPSIGELTVRELANINKNLEDLNGKQGVRNEILLELLSEVRELGSANFGAQARPVRHIPPPSRRLLP